MRNNSHDRTVERNYIQKWRFLIREYELVKAKSACWHPMLSSDLQPVCEH